MTIGDPHASSRHRVLDRVLKGPAETDASLRHAAALGKGAPGDLQTLIDKIHRHAYKVTDADIAAAQGKYGDDKVFEIVVSAALGAANQRLEAGLKALGDA